MNAFGRNDMSKVSDPLLKKLTLTRLQFEVMLLEVQKGAGDVPKRLMKR